MSRFTLALKSEGEVADLFELDLDVHVHQRIEKFIFQTELSTKQLPLAVIETNVQTSEDVLHVSDSRGLVKELAAAFSEDNIIREIKSNSFLSSSSEVYVTHKRLLSNTGETIALWYKHVLDKNCVSASVEVAKKDFYSEDEDFYEIDLTEKAVYCNFRNEVSEVGFKVYFISQRLSNGDTMKSLLNPVSAVSELTWEDVDPDTGLAYSGIRFFTKERIGNNYIFTLDRADSHWIRERNHSLFELSCSKSSLNLPWFGTIKNGDFSLSTPDGYKRYYLPEFERQAFSPHYPYLRSEANIPVHFVGNAIKLSHKIFISEQTPLEVICFTGDTPVKAFATDSTLVGRRFSADVTYELLSGWFSEEDSIIFFNNDLSVYTSIFLNYTHNTNNYIIDSLNLNVFMNAALKNSSYVFYLIPDVETNESALHWLLVDDANVVLDTSQGDGASYINLKFMNDNDTLNENTIVGKAFQFTEDSFLENKVFPFSAGTEQYLLLGSVSFIEPSITNFYEFTQNERYSDLKEAIASDNSLLLNEKTQSLLGFEYPKENVTNIDVPIDLLEEMGGDFTRLQIREELARCYPEFSYLSINFTWPKPLLEATSTSAAIVDLSCSWVGDGTYTFYRKYSEMVEWEEIDSIVSIEPEDIATTSAETSETLVWYTVAYNSYPKSNYIKLEVL